MYFIIKKRNKKLRGFVGNGFIRDKHGNEKNFSRKRKHGEEH